MVFSKILTQKPQKEGRLSSLPHAEYSTAGRITDQTNRVSFPSAKNKFFADGKLS